MKPAFTPVAWNSSLEPLGLHLLEQAFMEYLLPEKPGLDFARDKTGKTPCLSGQALTKG